MVSLRPLRTQTGGGPEYPPPPRPLQGDPSAQRMSGDTRPRRIVLYSHDTQGLGHMRRNLLLARALLELSPRPNILLIGGARELGAMAIPEGIDCLTLPALRKHGDGGYRPRSLSISLRRIIELRAGAIEATVASYDPDLLIVDKVPRGAFGELEPTLRWLREQGKARCVLGLREILDEPEVAAHEWRADDNDAAVHAYYDQIWVYGDPRLCDPAGEYGFDPEVADKLVYTGYLDRGAYLGDDTREAEALWEQLAIPAGARVALCCVGGGQDGFALARSFARAALPDEMVGVIIAGPFMPPAEQQQLAQIVARRPQLRIATFLDEPAPLMRRAHAIVAMAGYNTVCEILSFARRALLVPRVRPRREQLIRAERLRDLGLVDMLHPSRLSPRALGDWLAAAGPGCREVREQIDLGALARLPGLVHDLVYARPTLKEIACAD